MSRVRDCLHTKRRQEASVDDGQNRLIIALDVCGEDSRGCFAVWDLGLSGGQGRGRTADLPIFSRTLVPTELPGRCRPGWQRRHTRIGHRLAG